MAKPNAPKIIKQLPTAPGFQANLHWTWPVGAPPPIKSGLPIDMIDAEHLGLGKISTVDSRLAAILDAQFSQAKVNPYSIRAGHPPTLTDKAARQLSKANAAVYEKTSKAVSNLNASAILIGSLSIMLGEMAASPFLFLHRPPGWRCSPRQTCSTSFGGTISTAQGRQGRSARRTPPLLWQGQEGRPQVA